MNWWKNYLRVFINSNKLLIFILVSCFFLNIGYSFYYQIRPAVDARAYDNIAQNIANGNGYKESLDVGFDFKTDYAIARVGPIYEYFLAIIYKIFGHNYPAVWIIQSFLRIISTLLLYLTVLLIFKENESKKKSPYGHLLSLPFILT